MCCSLKRRHFVPLLGADIFDLVNCARSTSGVMLRGCDQTGDPADPMCSTNIYTISEKAGRLDEGVPFKLHFIRVNLPGVAEWLP